MLNRRSLRVKVMQTLFALSQCKEANFNIGLAEIEEAFQPDLNSMEPQDKVQLKADSKQAKSILNHRVNGAPLKEISAQPRSSTKIIITFGFFISAKELKLNKAIKIIKYLKFIIILIKFFSPIPIF